MAINILNIKNIDGDIIITVKTPYGVETVREDSKKIDFYRVYDAIETSWSNGCNGYKINTYVHSIESAQNEILEECKFLNEIENECYNCNGAQGHDECPINEYGNDIPYHSHYVGELNKEDFRPLNEYEVLYQIAPHLWRD